jgi:hypothetical protein
MAPAQARSADEGKKDYLVKGLLQPHDVFAATG